MEMLLAILDPNKCDPEINIDTYRRGTDAWIQQLNNQTPWYMCVKVICYQISAFGCTPKLLMVVASKVLFLELNLVKVVDIYLTTKFCYEEKQMKVDVAMYADCSTSFLSFFEK